MELFYKEILKEVSRYRSKKDIEDICFKSLIDSYQRLKKKKGIELLNENRIRDEFVIDMEKKSEIIKHAIDNYIIIIIPESWDPINRKRTDITFCLPFNRRELIFECKKLYSAEQRYLDDGLIRFIRLEYSKKEKDAGMIGFIIKPKHLSKTIAKIKEKICKFYFLRLIDGPIFGFPYSFQSIHVRVDSREILICHLFFKF